MNDSHAAIWSNTQIALGIPSLVVAEPHWQRSIIAKQNSERLPVAESLFHRYVDDFSRRDGRVIESAPEMKVNVRHMMASALTLVTLALASVPATAIAQTPGKWLADH